MGKVSKVSKAAQARKEKMPTHVQKHSPHDGKKYTFFYTTASPFSQFHPCAFTVDGVKYNCAEQYMMHQKAVVFKDDVMAAQILKESDPKSIKACGRKVQNFVDKVWTDKCRDIVREGNIAKFSQNMHLKTELFSTEGSTLVEASPRDRRWGIGLGKDNPKALNRETWRGSNWLGFALTDVRDQLMKQESGAVGGASAVEGGASNPVGGASAVKGGASNTGESTKCSDNTDAAKEVSQQTDESESKN